MKLTDKEMEQAKRASLRLWCKGDENGKHTLRKTVFPDMTMWYKCIKCDFASKEREAI